MYTFLNLDQTLIGMSQVLLDEGTWRTVRGFNCLEIPHPVLIEIVNPTDRYITIPARKWNKTLPWAESLWMVLGMNDLHSLVGDYLKSLYTYADDGHTWRGGYGPRIRGFSGIATDYNVSSPKTRDVARGYVKTVDQLKYVVDAIKRDPYTRQAIIQIGDPVKDCFDYDDKIKQTKDFPCSRTLQFMVVDGRLNCSLTIRSNDLMYGLSAVNTTNFTLMQEYIANILGIPVGKYYMFINNLHIYKPHLDAIKIFAEMNMADYTMSSYWQYSSRFKDLKYFDAAITALYYQERGITSRQTDQPAFYGHDFLDDWLLVFWKFHHKNDTHKFKNPMLNKLYKL